VFVTSTSYGGNLGGLAGADGMCAVAAARSGLPGHYVAWLATASASALSRLGNARGWIRTDGLPFADQTGAPGTNIGIRNGQIFYSPSYDEFGNSTEFRIVNVWTGAHEDGSVISGYTCNDWMSDDPSVTGFTGLAVRGSGSWTDDGFGYCGSLYSLYCFEVDLSTTLILPPPAGRLAFLSTGTFATSGGIPAADSLCQDEATSAGLPNPSSFVALLSTTSASAAARVDLSGAPWVRPDGIPLTASAADLVRPPLQAAPSQHADGSYATVEVFPQTGGSLATAGTDASSCSNWTSNASLATSTVGESSDPFNWFLGSTAVPCSSPAPVFCFQR
jgi:hypothetical protein